MAGSPSTAIATDDEDEEDDDEEEEHYRLDTVSSPRADEAEVLDDRTMTNFQKYFVLPESEKLLTGEKMACPAGVVESTLLTRGMCVCVCSLSMLIDEDIALLWKTVHLVQLHFVQCQRLRYQGQGKENKKCCIETL